MNTFQALVKLNEGKKITHEGWTPGEFLYMKGDFLFDERGFQVSFKDFIRSMAMSNSKGYHLHNKKSLTKNVKVDDFVEELVNNHGKFKVKYIDDECVVLLSLNNNLSTRDGFVYSLKDWKENSHRYFKVVSSV